MGLAGESCYNCRRPLTEADFSEGRAIRVGSLAACERCADPLLARLTPEQRAAIFRKLQGEPPPEEDASVEILPPEEPPPQAVPSRGTTAHLRARPPASSPPDAPGEGGAPASRKNLLLGAAVAGGIIILGIVVLLLTSSSRESSGPPPGPAAAGRPAGPPADPKRVETARAALEKARSLEKAKIDDLAAVARLYERAAREAEGTPLAEEARRGLDAVTDRLRTAQASDIAALEKEVRGLADAQDYPKAVERLDTARGRRDAPEWGQAVERLSREVRDTMDGAFLRLKSRTVDAYRFGDAAEVRKGRDEVARWGVPRFAEELEKALAENRAQVLRDSLVGWWKLDETAGNKAADASGNRSTGQLKGKPAWVAGKIGGGLQFNDENDYVELPAYGPLDNIQSGGFTAAAWFMPSEVPTRKSPDNNAYFGILIKSGAHMGLSYNSGQGFQMDYVLDRDVKAGVWIWDKRYEPGRFHHVAGVVDPSAGKTLLYVNGKLAGASTWKAGTPPRRYNRTPWRIGIANPGDRDWRWPARGVVDDVRLYRRALSDDEILMVFEGRDQPAER